MNGHPANLFELGWISYKIFKRTIVEFGETLEISNMLFLTFFLHYQQLFGHPFNNKNN